MVVQIEDVNLPKPDRYGTIQLVAALQGMVSHGVGRGFDPWWVHFSTDI